MQIAGENLNANPTLASRTLASLDRLVKKAVFTKSSPSFVYRTAIRTPLKMALVAKPIHLAGNHSIKTRAKARS